MVDDDGEGGEQRGEGEFGQRGGELRGVLGAEELAAGVVEQAGGGEAVVGGEGLGGGGGGRRGPGGQRWPGCAWSGIPRATAGPEGWRCEEAGVERWKMEENEDGIEKDERRWASR